MKLMMLLSVVLLNGISLAASDVADRRQSTDEMHLALTAYRQSVRETFDKVLLSDQGKFTASETKELKKLHDDLLNRFSNEHDRAHFEKSTAAIEWRALLIRQGTFALLTFADTPRIADTFTELMRGFWQRGLISVEIGRLLDRLAKQGTISIGKANEAKSLIGSSPLFEILHPWHLEEGFDRTVRAARYWPKPGLQPPHFPHSLMSDRCAPRFEWAGAGSNWLTYNHGFPRGVSREQMIGLLQRMVNQTDGVGFTYLGDERDFFHGHILFGDTPVQEAPPARHPNLDPQLQYPTDQTFTTKPTAILYHTQEQASDAEELGDSAFGYLDRWKRNWLQFWNSGEVVDAVEYLSPTRDVNDWYTVYDLDLDHDQFAKKAGTDFKFVDFTFYFFSLTPEEFDSRRDDHIVINRQNGEKVFLALYSFSSCVSVDPYESW